MTREKQGTIPSTDDLLAALRALLADVVREAAADAFAEHSAGEPPKRELLSRDEMAHVGDSPH